MRDRRSRGGALTGRLFSCWRVRQRSATALLVAATLLAGGLLAQGEGSPSVSAEEAELAEIRAEIAALERRLGELRDRQTGLAGQIERIDLHLALQRRKVAEAVTARRLAAERAARSELAVARSVADLDDAREALSRRLTGLYRLGRQGYLRLLVAADPGADVLAALRTIRFLARRDREIIGRFQLVKGELSARRDELVIQRKEAEEWNRQEEAQRGELVRLRRRHAELLAQAETERLSVAARAVELAAAEGKVAERLAALGDELGDRATPLAGVPLADVRGALDWPIDGRVALGFGPRFDPRYRTQVPHNGLTMVTEPGRNVRVVYPGKVLFAAPFEDYGPTIVVHHPGRAFTLYAGLAQLRVEEGDVVSLGQLLGIATDQLYFEIRIDKQPQDPLDWLADPTSRPEDPAP